MDLELSDIINDHKSSLQLTSHQFNVLSNIQNCRTEELGTHSLKCSNPKCKHIEFSFNSCRDRNCPKCLGSKQLEWANARNHEILPVDYSHVIFTVPSYLNELFEYNKKECYTVLFKSVSETFKYLTPVTKHNNPKNGYIAILHTWSQLLNYHIHLHCLVPEGQFNKAKNRWEKSNNKILKKNILNITFKRILSKNLIKFINKNKLIYPGITEEYITRKLKTSKNHVFLRKSLENVTNVIKYLSNYTNKIAITNDRIKSYDGKNISISYVNRGDGNKIKTKKIDAIVFLKRYCLHILPYKLIKIRYYGFMANSCKKRYLKVCKDLLIKNGNKISETVQRSIDNLFQFIESLGVKKICLECHIGVLELVGISYGRSSP